MAEEEIDGRVKKLEDTTMLIHYDLKGIKDSLGGISTALKTLADVQTKQMVMEERYENRHNEQKKINAQLHEENVERVNDIAKINGVFTRISWTVITIIIGAIMVSLGFK